MSKYFTVWTPKKISEFVTEGAVGDGGHICSEHQRECDAYLNAVVLNEQTAGLSGYYCVMIEDET